MRLVPVLCLAASRSLLTGCALTSSAPTASQSGSAITGTVHGGQQPIVGAKIYLLAANTTGAGAASTSLLTSGTSGTDTVGGYVLSGTGGAFSVTGDYLCTPNTQVYLLALGGNPGAGTNSASGLMAALGNCPVTGSFFAIDPVVSINEVSTVAAAYSMAGYATDATHVSSSGSTAALTGIGNAFASAGNLVSLPTGLARLQTPNGNGTVPLAEINTLANILAACINTTSAGTACSTLFADALGTASSAPSETASAAINLAHRPGKNVAALYALQNSTAPFVPSLTAAPNDFSIGIVWNISSGALAFDSAGNLWTTSTGVLKYSNLGDLLSPAAGYTGGGLSATSTPNQTIAIDPSNNVWVTSYTQNTNVAANNFLSKFSNAGLALSPSTGFTGGGLNQPTTLAIDGTGAVWAGNYAGGTTTTATVARFTNAGVAYTGSPFSMGVGAIVSLAVDNINELYAASNYSANYANNLAIYNSAGTYLRTSPSSGSAELTNLSVDGANNVWGTRYPVSGSNTIFKYSSYFYTPTGFPFTGNTAVQHCLQTQIDGDGNMWCASDDDSIAEVSAAGANISPDAGYVVSPALGPEYLAIDNAGNVWTTGDYTANSAGSITGLTVELIGAAAPVITPLSLAIQQGKLGSRP